MSACDIARTMSLFEIDEALDLLIESAAEQAAGDEISDELRNALSEYVDAFGEKVDRIASYIRAQEACADAAKKEAFRLEARRKAAEMRIRMCKSFLCWFMTSRSLKQLKGRLNTFTPSSNSVDSLLVDDVNALLPAFQSVTVTLSWQEWLEMLVTVPDGPLRLKLSQFEHVGKGIDRARIADALRSGQAVPGARLLRGQHVRLK